MRLEGGATKPTESGSSGDGLTLVVGDGNGDAVLAVAQAHFAHCTQLLERHQSKEGALQAAPLLHVTAELEGAAVAGVSGSRLTSGSAKVVQVDGTTHWSVVRSAVTASEVAQFMGEL